MAPEIIVLAAYLLLGLAAGLFAGLLGIGGGIVIVPALWYLFARQEFASQAVMQLAVATSLASIVFTAMASTHAHHRRGAVLWPAAATLAPGIILGALLGALAVGKLTSDMLRVAFGIFEILVALQIGLGINPAPHRELPGAAGMFAVGAVIGVLSALLGIGGGTMTVPFLLWCNIGMRQAVATSAACGLPIAVAGTAGMMVAGWGEPGLPAGSLGYVYWPAALAIVAASMVSAPWGARLAHALPVITLRRIFAVLLALIGLRMIV